VLDAHWDSERGHTYPHRRTYPHQWLWDSCFAAIAWAAVGEPERGVRELDNALSAQFDDGFVPHMRYAFENNERGPRTDCSSFTQPPIHAHAARVLRIATLERVLGEIRRDLEGGEPAVTAALRDCVGALAEL